MRKLGLSLLATGLLSVSSIAAAGTPDMSGYQGGFNGLQAKTLFPATDISVINATDRSLKVSVPGTSLSSWVYTKSSPFHITHTGGAFFTNVLIQDSFNYTAFNGTVCPRAIITVYGTWTGYSWYVDEEYCY